MKKLIFYLELLTSLRVVTGKEKRAAKILTSGHDYHLRLTKHTKHHASCCIASSRLAHRGNRKSGQATRDNENEGIVCLSVANPFQGRKSKLS
jgi:hypothetical protein